VCDRRVTVACLALLVLLGVTAGGTGGTTAVLADAGPAAAFAGADLRAYYPNLDRYQTQYLEGRNYVPHPDAPDRAVLWFERQDQWTWRMYNWAPEDPGRRCHYDQLSWWDDGYLRYVRTVDGAVDGCGSQRTEIVYDPPIIFLPTVWSGQPWRLDGTSTARYLVDGQRRCEGTTSWTAEIPGVEQIAPGEAGLHWRTTQTTAWTTGDVVGGCYAGYATRWQEDYWLTNQLPDLGGVRQARGLKRTKGGNLDAPATGWDIWMDRWAALPPT
jgi:hypothetical protein